MIERLDRLVACACAVILAAGIALGAAPAAAAQKVSLRLDWVNSGYHAIWYYGIDKGIFQKAGIDLDVLEGNGSAVTAQTVGNGSVMFGTADTAAVMGLVSQGMPVKIVGGYLRQSPLALIFPADKGWKKFSDMAGAKIGWSAGGATSQLLPSILKSAGLDGKVQLINMEPAAKMTALLTGRVDAIDSFDFLMVSILEGKGLKVSTLPYASAGVNVPGLSLITSDNIIKKDPALVRKMVEAMEETLVASRKDPEGAIDSLMKRSPTLDRAVVLRTLELSFNLLDPDWAKGKPTAWMAPKVIEKSQDILFKYGGIKKELPIHDYFTNAYVPAS
ncbi:MAG TPA: ABC transporter substrate-binding protein [Stellaceae bacterium]|nr:ABC transporter substrate-binding protein [Stellaceae bacterium]